MYQYENLHSSSIALITSRNHQLTFDQGLLQKTTIYENTIHTGCIGENAILCYLTRYALIYTTSLKCYKK